MTKFKFEYKAVIEPLRLGEYHPDYGQESIEVCVNPRPEFMDERSKLLNEYTERYAKTNDLMKERENLQTKQVKRPAKTEKRIDELNDLIEQSAADFLEWNDKEFVPQANAWFARLWSFGEDEWSVEDTQQIQEQDPAMLNWLKKRSMEMIEAHKEGAKKA